MADDQVDEPTRQLIQLLQIDASSQRPNRAAKPVGEGRFKLPSLILPRNLAMRSADDSMPQNLGKRKRVGSSPGGIEGGRSSGPGIGIGVGGSVSGKGKGKRKEKDGGSKGKAGNTKRNAAPNPTKDPEIHSPPIACRPRLVKRDDDVTITEDGPEVNLGDAPRYYAKIVREVEVFDPQFPKAIESEPLEESYRMPDHPPVLLALIDWGLFHVPDCTQEFSDRELVKFAMDPNVLPLLKQWAYMWLNPDNNSKKFLRDMRRSFSINREPGKPWKDSIDLVAEHAAHEISFDYTTAPLLHAMSSFAQRLIKGNEPFFEEFSDYSKATNEPHKFAARLLLVVWEDLETDRNGFFGVLLKSELACVHRPEVRRAYEGWYVVDERQFQ